MIRERWTTLVRTTRERPTLLAVLAVIAVLLAAGLFFLTTTGGGDRQLANGVVQDKSGKRVLYWFDPMVPNERATALPAPLHGR